CGFIFRTMLLVPLPFGIDPRLPWKEIKMDVILQAVGLVANANVIVTIIAASMFGLFVGAVPGLTATMATALLVPLTFFMEPVAAVGAIIACSALAIYSGEIPGALLCVSGTPSSAAYVGDTYKLTV